jgi:hypothetical protein
MYWTDIVIFRPSDDIGLIDNDIRSEILQQTSAPYPPDPKNCHKR